MRYKGTGHAGVMRDYLDIFHALTSKKAGRTPRECEKLVLERSQRHLTAARVIQVLEWMHVHDLAWRRLIGYRAHPHNYGEKLPIYLFGIEVELTEAHFEERVRGFWATNAKKRGRDEKVWSATALLEAWA